PAGTSTFSVVFRMENVEVRDHGPPLLPRHLFERVDAGAREPARHVEAGTAGRGTGWRCGALRGGGTGCCGSLVHLDLPGPQGRTSARPYCNDCQTEAAPSRANRPPAGSGPLLTKQSHLSLT